MSERRALFSYVAKTYVGEDNEFKSCEDIFLLEGVAYAACDPLKLDPQTTSQGAIWKVNYTNVTKKQF